MKVRPENQNQDNTINQFLDPRKIISIAGAYTSAGISNLSHIDDLEAFSLVLERRIAKNNQTGTECKMVYAEYKREKNEIDNDFDFVRHYAVELNTGNSYLISIFESVEENKSHLNYLKNEALKTFITWSNLI